jgi:hypothetical protein
MGQGTWRVRVVGKLEEVVDREVQEEEFLLDHKKLQVKLPI